MKQTENAMNSALQRQCDEIRQLLEKADVDEIATRYKVGAIVAKVRDEKGTFGEHAVDQLSVALAKHRGTLYRYAAVADLCAWRELRLFVMRKKRDGDVLSWSHWLELGRVRSTWKRWFERTLAEGWPVRELSHQLDLALADRGRDRDDAEDTTAEAFADSLRAVQRYDTEVTGTVRAVLERLERLPSQERPREMHELLARGMDLMEQAREKSDQLLARMRRLTGEAARKNTVAREN